MLLAGDNSYHNNILNGMSNEDTDNNDTPKGNPLLVKSKNFDVNISEPNVNIMAVQGPKSFSLMSKVFGKEIREWLCNKSRKNIRR